MALYKYSEFIARSDHSAFDDLHSPGDRVPHSGIYRCEHCGREAACNKGDPLPPQNHHQHQPPADIQWRLTVCTQAK